MRTCKTDNIFHNHHYFLNWIMSNRVEIGFCVKHRESKIDGWCVRCWMEEKEKPETLRELLSRNERLEIMLKNKN